VEPTGPAFGRPDDKLRDTHQLHCEGDGFREELHPSDGLWSGLALTASSQAKTGHVDGASRKREPHDNVQDGAQKNFPSNGFAGHTPSFRLSWIEDTILLSRGTSLYLLLRIIRTLAFPPTFEIRFDCAGSRSLSRRIAGIAHVGRYSRRSGRSQHRNTDRPCFRRVSVGLIYRALVASSPHERKRHAGLP
jgi:hypothetical protein